MHLPGAPFYIAGLLLLAAAFVAWRHAPEPTRPGAIVRTDAGKDRRREEAEPV